MELATIKEAKEKVEEHLKNKFNKSKNISESNISYLVQYGQIRKYSSNGKTMIDLNELISYYDEFYNSRQLKWNGTLGDDLNWALSFEDLREVDTTKHVHRLHPYKGKFIPQLVEYFIDDHLDEFKSETFFHKGDIILDPFMGSGTTLVQANELGMHSIGTDISKFNCLIATCKIQDYDFVNLNKAKNRVLAILNELNDEDSFIAFEKDLINRMSEFNKTHFPNPDYKYKVKQGLIDEDNYGKEKEKEFLLIYNPLIEKHNINIKQNMNDSFLSKWYSDKMKKEIDLVYSDISKEGDPKVRNYLKIILSRTVRSCRATKHYDLATLKSPQHIPYYCRKHKKICKPIMTIKSKLKQYLNDGIKRVQEYNDLKTDACFAIINGDARDVDIFSETRKENKGLHDILKKQRIKGIFTSPPYVGNIDYHEQHAYAYELFEFERKDDLEIGPLFKGDGKEARESYVEGISNVLINCKRFMVEDYDAFIVANDKHNLYAEIARKSGMEIVNKYKRPVLNRTERDRNPYSEIIFHLKEGDL